MFFGGSRVTIHRRLFCRIDAYVAAMGQFSISAAVQLQRRTLEYAMTNGFNFDGAHGKVDGPSRAVPRVHRTAAAIWPGHRGLVEPSRDHLEVLAKLTAFALSAAGPLQCPTCIKLKITEGSFFCGQVCLIATLQLPCVPCPLSNSAWQGSFSRSSRPLTRVRLAAAAGRRNALRATGAPTRPCTRPPKPVSRVAPALLQGWPRRQE